MLRRIACSSAQPTGPAQPRRTPEHTWPFLRYFAMHHRARRGSEVAALVAAILACAAVSSSPVEKPSAARSSVLALALGDAGIVAARLSTGTTSVELRVPPGVAGFEMLSCFEADMVARSGDDLPVSMDPCDGMERGSLLHIQGSGGNGTFLKQAHAPSPTPTPPEPSRKS